MTISADSPTLVESIMNDARQAQWERLPPMKRPAFENEVVQGRGKQWRVLVVRWKKGDEFHFEAVAASLTFAHVVRLPASDAAVAWKISEPHLQH